MTHAEYSELKKLLVSQKDLAKVQDYFFEFVERGGFMSMGRTLDRERGIKLAATLSEAFSRITDELLQKIQTQFIEVPQYHLIHGSVIVNGKEGSVLYFEDIGVGLFTIVWDPRTGETRFMRFIVGQLGTPHPN